MGLKQTLDMHARFTELDIWRGVAVLAMVLFHFVFDLMFFLHTNIDVYSGFWFWFARAIAGSFIFLAGISIPLALHRKKPVSEISYLVPRGFFLIGLGMLITLVTYFTFPTYTIWFGILHALGVCTLISIFFHRHALLSLVVGAFIWVMGMIFTLGVVTPPHLPGIFPMAFTTFDYFPLFPWLGIFLVGMGTSHLLYPHGKSRFEWSVSLNPISGFLVWCGRHSLGIYLIHQPVLIALILFFWR